MRDILDLVKDEHVAVQIDVDAANGAAAPAEPEQAPKSKRRSVLGRKADTPAAPSSAPAAPPQLGTDKQLDAFFADVESIKGLLMLIADKQQAVEEHHERSKFVTRTEDVKAAKAAMQADIDQVQKLAHTAKAKLEALDKANTRAAQQPGCGPGSSSERTRSTITAALRKRLRDGVEEFAGLRVRLQEEYREVVERRVFTVTGKAAKEDDIERLIESGDAETIFQKAMLEQGRGYVLDTLAEIQERHGAVQALEKSLLDLHQVFLDMAVLVETQGHLLDNIEAQVQRSAEYVEAGTRELQKAKKYQKSGRKIMCAVFILFLVIALGIALGITIPMLRKNKQGGSTPAGPPPPPA